MNAFEVLGLNFNADQAQVHAAYRNHVKRCHPDRFHNKEEQDAAQEQLIRLNLAYEEALRITTQRQVGFHTVSLADSKRLAQNLYDQKRYENALRQLARADVKDAEWFYIQGNILMELKQFATAHDSYREAVRRDPDNLTFRRGAFNAAVAVREHNKPVRRAMDKIEGFFKKR
ncbi:MAG: DnaJ domain-containing protein [Clostridia bacterium]|nr:DnaJ domain-containing protein [Clostridia bacterium]